jgi:hypothetical protein
MAWIVPFPKLGVAADNSSHLAKFVPFRISSNFRGLEIEPARSVKHPYM